jgi:Zn-dependent protease
MNDILYTISIWIVPVLFAITMHEAAHGWVANKLGDPTAKQLGRITANPFKHIDPMGTVVIPLTLLFLSGFVLGWAKPVPVDPRHFKQPLLDMAVVAVAGPMSNFLMACGWALMISLASTGIVEGSLASHLYAIGKAGITINVILMVLNLLPIPPLDGGRVVAGVLPQSVAIPFMRIEPYGMWIILALLFTGILGKILWPMVLQFENLISSLLIF